MSTDKSSEREAFEAYWWPRATSGGQNTIAWGAWQARAALPQQVQEAPTDEQITSLVTALFPRWREDIQERFVLEVARAVLAKGDRW